MNSCLIRLDQLSNGVYRQNSTKIYFKYLNLIFLTRSTVISSVAQWPRRLHCTQAVRVQALAHPFFYFFIFSFSFAVVCLSFRFIFLFLIVFCLLVCLSFIPTAAPSSELRAKLDKTPQRERKKFNKLRGA